MLGGKTTPVHAVFVNGLKTGIGETSMNFAQTTKAFFFLLVLAPELLRVGHDSDKFRAKTLHTRNGAFDFGECDVKIGSDLLSPVPDERAELGNGDPFGIELVGDFAEFVLRKFVNVCSVHPPRGDLGPANFLGGFDLGGEVFGCFVSESGQIHGRN